MLLVKMNKKTSLYILFILVVVCLTVIHRFALIDNIEAQDIASVVEGDTGRYEIPALHFMEHGTFAINPKDPYTTTVRNPPGYALFIMLNYELLGQDRAKLLKTQVVVSAFTIILVSIAAYLLWSWKVAFIGALLIALDPIQTLYSHVMLTETLFLFFISLIMVFGILMIKSKSNMHWWALLMGLAVALSTFVHSSNYYLIIPIVLALTLFKSFLQWSWVKLLKVNLMMLLPVLILFSAWQIRNGQLTGVYMFSDNSINTLLDYKASSVYAEKDGLSKEEARAFVRSQLPKDFSSLKERYEAEKALAVEIISNDLGAFISHSLKRYFNILLDPAIDGLGDHYDIENSGKLASGVSDSTNSLVRYIENLSGWQLWYLMLVAYSFVFLGLSYLLALFGFIQAAKLSTKKMLVIHLFLLGIASYYIALATGQLDGYHRQRLGSMLVVLLYAAYGLKVALNIFASRSRVSAESTP